MLIYHGAGKTYRRSDLERADPIHYVRSCRLLRRPRRLFRSRCSFLFQNFGIRTKLRVGGAMLVGMIWLFSRSVCVVVVWRKSKRFLELN